WNTSTGCFWTISLLMAFVPFDSAERFSAGEFQGVGRVAARGAGASMSAQAAGLGVQVVSTIVLARLLKPGDFGLVAMVTTFSLLFINFGINGFTEAILQADHITSGIATNLFWINVGAGALLTVASAALGVPIAWFFHAPKVEPIAAGSS